MNNYVIQMAGDRLVRVKADFFTQYNGALALYFNVSDEDVRQVVLFPEGH